jgi:hypothetical protein
VRRPAVAAKCPRIHPRRFQEGLRHGAVTNGFKHHRARALQRQRAPRRFRADTGIGRWLLFDSMGNDRSVKRIVKAMERYPGALAKLSEKELAQLREVFQPLADRERRTAIRAGLDWPPRTPKSRGYRSTLGAIENCLTA